MTDFILALVSIGGTLAIVLIIAVLIGRRGGRAKITKDGIEFSTDKSKPLPKHARCPAAREVIKAMELAGDTEAKIAQVRITTIEEQMKYLEASSVEMIRKILAVFVSLLSDRTQDEVVTHPEFTTYQATLKFVEGTLRDVCRKWFRENHFAEKSREEENTYIEQKVSTVMTLTTDLLNTYWRGKTIPRSDLYKANRELEDELRKEIEDVFRHAFEISRRSYEEVSKLRNRYESFVRETITG